MPDFKQSLPQPNPFRCDSTRHLWRNGLALAIYQKVGQLTYSPDGHRSYHTDTARMALFFGAHKTHVRKTFALLDRAGWLVVERDPDTKKAIKKDRSKKIRRWISHKEWAESHAGECIKVDEILMPWSVGVDPFAGRLYSALDGKIRIYEALVKHARSCGRSDSEIETALRVAWQTAKAKRERGEYDGTGAKTVFFATIKALREAA